MGFKLPKLPVPKPPRAPSPPKGMGRRQKLGAIPDNPLRRYGPRELFLFADKIIGNDWCVPPEDFVGAHNSASEWLGYAGLWKVLRIPGDPREPPYDGRGFFVYQAVIAGGRQRRGGQVCDYLVPYGGEEVCMRLQSQHWHVQTDHQTIVEDQLLKTETKGYRMVDIFEQDFIHDCTLQAVCEVVGEALRLDQTPNPAATGTSRVVRS